MAYAYLCDASQAIVADVWLYNRCAAPLEPEWQDRAKLPFANPIGFVDGDGPIAPIDNLSQVSVRWAHTDGDIEAHTYIRDVLAGVLLPGAAPGWSAMAAKDGPLAKVLDGQVSTFVEE